MILSQQNGLRGFLVKGWRLFVCTKTFNDSLTPKNRWRCVFPNMICRRLVFLSLNGGDTQQLEVFSGLPSIMVQWKITPSERTEIFRRCTHFPLSYVCGRTNNDYFTHGWIYQNSKNLNKNHLSKKTYLDLRKDGNRFRYRVSIHHPLGIIHGNLRWPPMPTPPMKQGPNKALLRATMID